MCLDDDQILLLLEGNLPASARGEVEAHLDGCEACRRLVAAAAGPTYDQRGSGTDALRTAVVDSAGHVERAREVRPAAPLARGSSIGRYLVLSLIGKGGMGQVYRAYDPELDRRVALKLLHTARGSEAARRLLAREARALGKLSHPNVIQVYDVGEHEGDVFVAMELLEGESLDGWCQRSPAPGWPEVLAAYLDAARGLSAAHAKGLVHRDVKPSNILRGDDGRVCVADFGLAAGHVGEERPSAVPASAEPASAEPASAEPAPAEPEAPPLSETMPAPVGVSGSLDDRLTETGAVLGTPLYMAPEQHEGERATAASDQYSLCVALYQGLYGVPPFTRAPSSSISGMMEQLLLAKSEGPPAAPPAGTPVPAWIHRALARGLALDPAARYPSMDALVAALGADPDAARGARWRRAGLGVVAAALLVVAGVGWARSGAFHDPCEHPERQLAGAWDDGVKGRVRAAFLGSARSYAEGTVTRVAAVLDRYGADWARMRGEVCAAARGDARRPEILALREDCLDRRRGQLRALTTLFAEKPDPQVLDRAVPAALELPPVAYCADTEALTARVRPPEDPALRTRAAELQPRIDRLEALFKAGKYKEGLVLGEPLLVEAAALPHPPLRAQAQLWVGKLRVGNGDFEGGRVLIHDAAVSASAGRDDHLAAYAWVGLLDVVGDRQRRFEEAAVIESLGQTALVRVEDEAMQAMWSNGVGVVRWRAGKLAEARVAIERGLALREKALGPDHPDVSGSLQNLGAVLCAMDECGPAARSVLERALALTEKSLGAEHPSTAVCLSNLGNALRRGGEYAESVADHERALALKEKVLGPEHPSVASSLNNLGNALFERGDDARALPLLERALAIKEKALGPDHPDVAGTLASVARIRVRAGQLDAARPLLDRALAVREKRQGPQHPDVAGPLLGLGELHLARAAPADAVPVLERALALDNAEYAIEIRLTLAEALWRVGRDRPRARALVEQARAAYERIGHRPGLDHATRWLSDHPPG